MASRRELAALWDEATAGFLRGDQEPPPQLRPWFASCWGSGDSAVRTDCFAEPFIGDLLGEVSAVILGLNPGRPVPDLQAVDGVYASDIRARGSYTAWAASWPYLGPAWTGPMGRANPFHTARHRWVQDWTRQILPPLRSHIVFELFPWHSARLPSHFRPDEQALWECVWEPLSEFGPVPVFAFGSKDLFDVLPALPGVEVLARFPEEGRTAGDCGFSAPTRTVLIGRVPTGGLLYVVNHHGSDGLPPRHEWPRHRELAERFDA
jgi:hypothetical protein